MTAHLCMNSLLPFLVCRARGRPDQKRTETLCGMLGAHGVNAPVPVEEAPHTPSDDASVPSKSIFQPLFTLSLKPTYTDMSDNVMGDGLVFCIVVRYLVQTCAMPMSTAKSHI